MNEEQLASALSVQIDAMLTGQPMPVEDGPEELRQLLALADQLAVIDLPPRPAFGQQLKQSLLDQQRGGRGSPTGLGGMSSLVILGLIALMGVIGIGTIITILAVTLLLPQRTPLPTSTPPLLSPIPIFTPTIVPSPPMSTRTAEATTTEIDTIQPPSSTTDRLVPTTTPSPPFPFDLVEQPSGGNTDGYSDEDHDDHGEGDDEDHDHDDDDD